MVEDRIFETSLVQGAREGRERRFAADEVVDGRSQVAHVRSSPVPDPAQEEI
jgi:hypothetical protein